MTKRTFEWNWDEADEGGDSVECVRNVDLGSIVMLYSDENDDVYVTLSSGLTFEAVFVSYTELKCAWIAYMEGPR